MSKMPIVLVAALLAVVAACAFLDSDDTEAASGKDIRVYVQTYPGNPDGKYPEGSDTKYLETTVESASTVKNVYERAAANLGLEIGYDGLGNIATVGGIAATGNKEQWNVHQWMPLGHLGWTSVAPTPKYDEWIISGTTYCLHISESSPVGGESSFDVPKFKPKSDGYIYVRFVQNYDKVVGTFEMQDGSFVDEGLVEDAFTEDIRREGFWIKGRGSSMGEVLINAMETNHFEVETTGTKTDENGNLLSDWVVSMFGIKGDDKFGENCYVYWSQFTYVEDTWGYNNYTLGYYDPGAYRYAACVLVVSIEGSLDTGGPLPDMSGGGTPEVKHSKNKVVFMNGDQEMGTQYPRYGGNLVYDRVPVPAAPEGKVFAGWGDIGKAITEDTVLEASFIDVSDGNLVRFFADGGGKALMHAEYVPDGGSPKYAGTVTKISTTEEDFTFDGWEGMPAAVTGDIDVHAKFESSPRKYSITFIDYDGSVCDRKLVDYGGTLPEADVPAAPPQPRPDTVDKTYTFKGWSISLSGFQAADFSDVRSGRLVYAYYDGTEREYTVTISLGGSETIEVTAKYGGTLGDSNYILADGRSLKTYWDEGMEREFLAGSVIYGDTSLYGVAVPGIYAFKSATVVSLRHTAATAEDLSPKDGKVTVGDIGHMENEKALEIDRATLSLLTEKFGRGMLFELSVPRGTISMEAGQMLDLLGGGTFLSFAVTDTNTNQHNINKALKLIDEYGVYTPVIKVDGVRKTDLPPETVLELPLVLAKGAPADSAMVWSLTDDGVPALKQCIYSGNRVRFALGVTSAGPNLINFVTGTNYASSAVGADEAIPYGKAEYSVEGGGAVLSSLEFSSDDGNLFLPSSLGGHPLAKVLPGAFARTSGVERLVIPSTVVSFDGSSLPAAGIKDVYFLGDEPVLTSMEGVRIHASSQAVWSSGQADVFPVSAYAVAGLQFEYYCVGDAAVLYRFLKGTTFDIPSYIASGGRQYALSVIGDSAFRDAGISNIVIPGTVTDIQTSAFEGSSILTLNFAPSGSLTAIWDGAFRNCSKLRNVSLPAGLEYVGAEAFRGCDTFTDVTVPNSCVALGEGVFSACFRLGTVSLGSGLSAVPERCFSECYMLGKAEVPASVSTVGAGAFEMCREMTSFDTSSAEAVGAGAFSGCVSLEQVVLGASLKAVGAGAFSGCVSLKTVVAFCAQPQGMETALDSLDDITFMVSNDVASSWTLEHDKIVPDDAGDGGVSFTVAVAGAMAVAFVAVGLVVFKLKRGV